MCLKILFDMKNPARYLIYGLFWGKSNLVTSLYVIITSLINNMLIKINLWLFDNY